MEGEGSASILKRGGPRAAPRGTMAVVLVVAELVVFGVAALASLGPARRAARADPLQVMRAT